MKNRCALAVLALTASLSSAAVATAAPITYTGSSGAYAAAATFEVSGSNLVITLTNTSTADVTSGPDLLTAVFFNLVGNPLLTRTSVVLAPGSTVEHGGTTDPGGVVGGEFAYLNGLNIYGGNQGVSNSGLGIFGPGDRFPGSDLTAPASPDGAQYGLASAGDDPATGNGSVSEPLIKNSVIITLGGLSNGFSLESLSHVTFQYGTALNEGHIPGDPLQPVPEPGTIALLGSGILMLGRSLRRRV